MKRIKARILIKAFVLAMVLSLFAGMTTVEVLANSSENETTTPSNHDHSDGWGEFNMSSNPFIEIDDIWKTATFRYAGKYYLTEDITGLKVIIDSNVTLCLNGHKISKDNSIVIEVAEGGSLTICNCKQTGCVESAKYGTASYEQAVIESKGDLNLYDVTIDASKSETKATGIFCNNYYDSEDDNDSTSDYHDLQITMKNCTIKGYHHAVRMKKFKCDSQNNSMGSLVADNCTFVNSVQTSYTIMAADISLNDCTVNAAGRAISSAGNEITLNNCNITGGCEGTNITSSPFLILGWDKSNIKIKDCELVNSLNGPNARFDNMDGSLEFAGNITNTAAGLPAQMIIYTYQNADKQTTLIADDLELEENQSPILINTSVNLDITQDTPLFKVEEGKDYASKFAWAGEMPEGKYIAFKTVGTSMCLAVTEPPHTHTVATTIDEKAATCTEDGNNKYYQCDCEIYFKDEGCTQETNPEDEIIPADHSWSTEWTKDETNHWHKCNNCTEIKDTAAHVDADEDNTCDICGYEKEVEDIEPPVHKHVLTEVPEKAATCTEDGNNKYYKCTADDCTDLFVDAEGKTTITLEETKIAALGHDWSGEWEETKEATDTEEGKKATLCERECGQKKVVIVSKDGEVDENEKLEKDAEVEVAGPIKEATLNNSKTELIGASNIFTETDKEAIEEGKFARVWIEIGKTNETIIKEADKSKVEEEAAEIMGEDAKVTYFDVNLFKQVGTEPRKEINEPGIAIKITIAIPEELLNTDKEVEREYKIIRIHTVGDASEVDVISGEFDAATGEFSFETDKFSTYAIVYSDTPVADETPVIPETPAIPEVPATGDTTNAIPFMALLFIGLGALVVANKKNFKNI